MKKFITNIVAVSSLFLAAQQVSAQKVVVNREVTTEKDGKMLLGHQLKEQFLKAPYADWYVKEHDEYALDQKAISELKKERLGSYDVIVFMGTWCEDSHRDFPRLTRILEEVGYPENKMTIIAVNRKKNLPAEMNPFTTSRKFLPLS